MLSMRTKALMALVMILAVGFVVNVFGKKPYVEAQQPKPLRPQPAWSFERTLDQFGPDAELMADEMLGVVPELGNVKVWRIVKKSGDKTTHSFYAMAAAETRIERGESVRMTELQLGLNDVWTSSSTPIWIVTKK